MSELWMRNISCFALTAWPTLSLEEMEEKLAEFAFRGISRLEKEHRGFAPVFGLDARVHKAGDAYWFQVKTEQKKVPGAVLKRLLAERMFEIEQREGRQVGRKERKELKDILADELLAKAIPVPSQVIVMVDPKANYLMIDTASGKVADAVLSLLVRALNGTQLGLLESASGIAHQMTNLLLAEETEAFVADSTLVLKAIENPGTTVRFSQCNLSEPEVIAHLNKGMLPSSLALTWDDRLSFVLSDTFVVRRLTYLDQMEEEVEALNDLDLMAQLNGLLVLQVGELRELYAALTDWLSLKVPSFEEDSE